MALALFCAGTSAKAQIDPHFSLYYVYPSWLNPALTGVFDGDYRISGIYRNQWGNISTPYSTPGVSVDFNTNKNASFGVSVLNQSAGDGGYNYTTAYGNLAYNGLRFGAMESKRVVIAMQFGFIQRKFDPNKLTFGDQWNGGNPPLPTSDVFTTNRTSSFDMGAGAFFYDAQPGQLLNVFGGFAVSHLTRPTDQFSVHGDEKIPMRYTGHAGMRIALSETFNLTPNFMYLSQGSAREKMAGLYGKLKVGPVTDFMLGANYRFDDAISPYAGFTHKNFLVGLAYDINTSDLGKLANGANSFEITLSYIGKKSVKTPEVEFVCPRL
jgi:type IX secretion system PorP/SprF family membrane protein